MVEFQVINWDELMMHIVRVASRIKESGFKPDVVIGVLRGGYIIAKLLCDLLGIEDLEVMGVVSYGVRIGIAEEPVITHPPLRTLRGLRVLIADDIADTGRTLKVAKELMRLYGVKEVKTVTIFVKPWCSERPDYYSAETDKWVVFPWELGEVVREYAKSQGISFEDAVREIGLEGKFDKDLIDGLLKALRD